MKSKFLKKQFTRHLGTALMVTAVLFLGYIYYPIVYSYISPPPVVEAKTIDAPYVIEIPAIQAQAPIVLNVDPWNDREYTDKLKNGVAHTKGTALPGQDGGTYLFAHSSDMPWNITRYNTAFFKLNQLTVGDTITIYHGDTPYIYSVTDTKEIWPTEVEYLTNRKADLTLQTCTPIGTDLKRLLIFATLKK